MEILKFQGEKGYGKWELNALLVQKNQLGALVLLTCLPFFYGIFMNVFHDSILGLIFVLGSQTK
ncbi:hypothetical protein DRF67_11595 [Chryseobacterium pennipullorum]|uniref:Uncharacterized protein n=1 Tax=Chryseobacterium pennipullorum TaxID=2258963 RepID=A0A3D9B1R6_9FLAO|nr:hypothetical protein DRF67_11595 [Chryseobacterium pennipullorum]